MSKMPSWLNNAVFYEIYPQSFYDSNGDGVGDLNGIAAKLEYIKSLGVNAIWINPCFVSPFADAGYDVADFYKIAPRYGTNSDMKRLLGKAHKLSIKVCLDLVAGHTSIEHPWFKASASHEKNKYTNWYIWTDSVWQHAPEFQTVHGFGSRDGNFLINFFWFQPALNYGFAHPDPEKPWQLPMDHPDVLAVRDEMKKIMRFWLDMGVDGFRVDMASSLVKGDADWEATSLFWKDVRKMFDREYPEAVLISEWFYPEAAINSGFHIDFMANGKGKQAQAYNVLFRKESTRRLFKIKSSGHSFFDAQGKGNIKEFMDVYQRHYENTKGNGHISLFSGNHDVTRISVGRTDAELKLVFAFLLTMPGVPFIYYGDEIGMRYVAMPSKEGGYHRTGSRTPMQWDSSRNAGFSTAAKNKLYLPIDGEMHRPVVETQESDPSSLLNAVRALIELRKKHPSLASDGQFKSLYCKKDTCPLVYLRQHGRERFIIAINPSGNTVSARFKSDTAIEAGHLVAGFGATLSCKGPSVTAQMGPISYGIFKI